MAKLVGAYQVAHSPFCFTPAEKWNDIRAARKLRADVPMDDLETNQLKSARIKDAFGVLRGKIDEAKPDVIVIFGDDQYECFDFNNFPSFAVYVGEEFEGHTSQRDQNLARRTGQAGDAVQEEHSGMARMKGHPELGVQILTGVMKRGFDPAFCMDMPKPEKGLGHAFLRPAESITDMKTPVLPVLLNCYYAPQPTAERCYQFGKAVREAIEDMPGDLRVAVVGSGGLWHTPGAAEAWLNTDFDQEMLGHLAEGDVKGAARMFDEYNIPNDDKSQYIGERGRSSTGMPGFGGPQGGTREICNWIAAAGVVDGTTGTIVDYVPVYSSPVGAGFMHYDV